MKKDQLVAMALSKGITIDDKDTVKMLCDKLQDKPNSPNSLANEMEYALKMRRSRNVTNQKRRLNDTGIRNDLVKMYGKKVDDKVW